MEKIFFFNILCICLRKRESENMGNVGGAVEKGKADDAEHRGRA